METTDYVLFCSHNPTAVGHFLSQWWPVEFVETLDNNTIRKYNCAEQYMMVKKAELFGDKEVLEDLLVTDKPAKLKELGRKVKGFDPTIWDKHKFNIVLRGNRLKFEQNAELMKKLLETGNKTIVEAAHYDKIWGNGLSAEDSLKIPEDKWPGENLLGKALMIVRNENK